MESGLNDKREETHEHSLELQLQTVECIIENGDYVNVMVWPAWHSCSNDNSYHMHYGTIISPFIQCSKKCQESNEILIMALEHGPGSQA